MSSRISMVVLGGLLSVSAGCGLKPADPMEAKAAKSLHRSIILGIRLFCTKFLGIIYRTLKNKWMFEAFPNFVLAEEATA